MPALSITTTVHFKNGPRGRKMLKDGITPACSSGAIPRLSRLMALAIRFEEMIGSGKVSDQAELGRVGYVSRARITQIMHLLYLAPDIQEEILFLPQTVKGRDLIRERQIRNITLTISWAEQRRLWKKYQNKLK